MHEIHLKEKLNPGIVEAGCDEAGRGPLAGPVFAAAVILPDGFSHPLLDDSKKMSAKARETLRHIIESEAVAYSVTAVSAEEIDRINILNASIAGMWRSVMSLGIRPRHIIVDGNRFIKYQMIPGIFKETDRSGEKQQSGHPWDDIETVMEYSSIPFSCIVKGDAQFTSIAAASVLAKTYRDEYMRHLAEQYPQYGWESNMGYPTKEHIEAIRKYGYTPHHRKSFHVRELEPSLF